MCHCWSDDISCCCCIQTRQNSTQTFSKTRLRCGLVTTIGLILLKQALHSFYDCTPNRVLFFTIFILCWFACLQSAGGNLWCISNLDVCIEIENFWNWFIVRIDELTTHGPFLENHKWIHTVDGSIQTKPKSFIYVVVVFVLMYVCRRRWHEWVRKNLHSQPFLKYDAEWEAECSSDILQQCFVNAVISPKWIWFQCTASIHVIWKCVCSHVQPSWWKWNDGIRPVILVPQITASFHLFKDWLTMSVVDIVCS